MKNPPYGRDFRSHPNGIWITVGKHAWDHAKIIQGVYRDRQPLVMPDAADYRNYHWQVAGEDIVLLLSSEHNPDLIHDFGVHLVKQGAARVVVIGEIGNLPPRLTLFCPAQHNTTTARTH